MERIARTRANAARQARQNVASTSGPSTSSPSAAPSQPSSSQSSGPIASGSNTSGPSSNPSTTQASTRPSHPPPPSDHPYPETNPDGTLMDTPADMSTADLLLVCQSFVNHLRSGSAPWLLQRLNNTYGPMPSDPSLCSFWMASVSPLLLYLSRFDLISFPLSSRSFCLGDPN